jgi:F-box-like
MSNNIPRRMLTIPPEKCSTPAVSAINRVPPNAWSKIFKVTAEEEYWEYIGNPENASMPDYPRLRPLAYVLSHVCRSWRNVVHNSPLLWDLVYIPPSSSWRNADSDLLNASLQKSPASISLTTNLFHTPSDHHSAIHPNEAAIFDGQPYTLHIHMRDDNPKDTQKLLSIPLYNANALIISSSTPLKHHHFFLEVLEHGFHGVTSLTFINDYPASLQAVHMPGIFPKLTSLRFRFKEFPQNFPMSGYLGPNLEELHIHAEFSGRVQALTGISLSNIHTLGIHLKDLSSFGSLMLKSLKHLVLYGPQDDDKATNTISNNVLGQIWKQLECIEFEEWNAGAVPLIRKMASLSKHTIRCVKFSRSYVAGKGLVNLIENTWGLNPLPLEEVTLNQTWGITRSQCERIQPLLNKMDIYV